MKNSTDRRSTPASPSVEDFGLTPKQAEELFDRQRRDLDRLRGENSRLWSGLRRIQQIRPKDTSLVMFCEAILTGATGRREQ